MKKIFIITILIICFFLIGCKKQKNEEFVLIDSNDQVVNEEDKVLLKEITSQDFTLFEHVSIIGAGNYPLLLISYVKDEINNILSMLKISDQEFLYKHNSIEDDNPLYYIYDCMHIDFENKVPRMGNPKSCFYVSKDGRVMVLFYDSEESNSFCIYYTNKNVVNYQELFDYYRDLYSDNWIRYPESEEE